jgi:fumarylacetoacetase
MIAAVDGTHAVALQSWLESANHPATDFPVQNLPFGRFRRADDVGWCIGVAIGDQVLDLRRARLIETHDMNRLMCMLPEARASLRQAISEGLRAGSREEAAFREALVPQARLTMALPCQIGDYTDFYIGIHHALAVGKLLRPDNPLLPNYKWVPIGYHGRASSINASPSHFKRPMGQLRGTDDAQPTYAPTARLDYELELGLVIGRPSEQGEPIPITQAEEHLFGVALFNDWSARDIQAWEYQPLGPFQSKNFASTLSPWVVTMEALAPFRKAFTRPPGDPQPLPHLDSPANREQGAIDIELEVWIQTPAMLAAGHAGDRLSTSNFTDGYWTAAQLVTHHTANGCNLASGDLFGSGTLSGARPDQGGSLLELSGGGKQPIRLSNGETRTFLEDGDTIIFRGSCSRDGFRRIGFGECRGTVLAAKGSL